MTTPSASKDSGQGAKSGPLLPAATLGFVVAVIAVLVIAVASYRSSQSRYRSATLVTRTLEVLEQLKALAGAVKDAETGQRGFLLTGEQPYLDPYVDASAALPGALQALRSATADDPEQQQRLDLLERLVGDKMAELGHTVDLRRAGDAAAALAIMRTDSGKATMDRIRSVVSDMTLQEQRRLAARDLEWREASAHSTSLTWGGSAILLGLIGAAGLLAARDHRARETQVWLRVGRMGLGARMQGEQRLEKLGANVLAFLAEYLDAQVGAVYMTAGDGCFRRFAGHALSPAAAEHESVLRPGDSLIGQAARDGRAIHVRDVPDGYLTVASGLGRGNARHLLIAPAISEGVVHAVVELGFFHPVEPADVELLGQSSEAIAVAVRSSMDRTRLEDLLEETQRQGEELQTQQEELRVANEELQEQGRVLKESQARLEVQQAELEQTNSQLEEQTQLLEAQKDQLARTQIDLAERATELERSNQYKTEFLANMSHELRTPLNSSLILAKLLADNKDGNLTAEQVKFAQTISAAGNDLLALINDILDLSKIEAGKVDVEPEVVPLARTLDALLRGVRPLADEKGLRLTSAVAAGTPDEIETDLQRLGQILRNLLSNALKFTEKGEVTLHVSAGEGDTLRFAVEDTGIGIPPEQQAIIFEAFRQADGSTHRKYGGTGLGLSISRDLARLLGGDITVHSARDAGSTFTLTLPVRYRAAAAAKGRAGKGASPLAAARSAAAPSLVAERGAEVATTHTPPLPLPGAPDDRDQLSPAGRVILVVEDDVRFAAILRDVAHEMGFQCIVTHSAGDGLAAASAYRPSAILLDMNLPDHSGLGVLDLLKRNPQTRHIPVHVASVADYSREALELGAVGYALKPVKREDLVEAFRLLEAKLSQSLRRVLVVEDDQRQRESLRELLSNGDVQVTGAETALEALELLRETTFDCMVMDLNLPDLSGYELLDRMAQQEEVSFPPVIVYTGRMLTRDEEQRLRRFSRSIIIKDARSPERLLDEVTLFLHQVEANLSPERQRMLKEARNRETLLEGRRILVVEDDVRNVFALTSVLEPKGAKVEVARNGKEALEALRRCSVRGAPAIDLVLMDIMMPEMDGLTAMREIRKLAEWKKLPIIALTAKAMKDDHEKCLAAGANDYIAKPLNVERLLSLVRVWMPK